jgi:FkbM family methyltransferase
MSVQVAGSLPRRRLERIPETLKSTGNARVDSTLKFFASISKWIGKPRGWERIVRHFTSPEKCIGMPDIRLSCDGYTFIAQPSVQLGWQVSVFGTYEPELRDMIRSVLRPGYIALDIGANVGWHTLLMASLVGEQGRVLALEPNPSVRARLTRHVEINKFHWVDIFPFAASSSEGKAQFFGIPAEASNSGSSHLLVAGDNRARNQMEVEMSRVDRIVCDSGIRRLDFIKLDIEGHEWPALIGAEESVARFRPQIAFEYGADYALGSPEELAGFFAKHRYRIFGGTKELKHPSHWVGCGEISAVPEVN